MDFSTHVNTFFDHLSIYEDEHSRSSYGKALRKSMIDFIEKQDFETARLVYVTFFRAYWIGTQEIDNPFTAMIESLKVFESTLGVTFCNQRDHYIHTANVFILGISLYALSNNAKILFSKFIKDTGYKDHYLDLSEEFLYRWGIASLFHDVAYPIQLLFGSLDSYLSQLFKYPCKEDGIRDVLAIKKSILLTLHEVEVLLPEQQYADEFYQKYPLLKSPKKKFAELMSEYISNRLGMPYKDILQEIENYEKKCALQGIYDHAYYGSVVSLKWYYSLIFYTKWNPAYFYFSVIDSSCAIFLHNAYRHMIMKFVGGSRLNYSQLPLSYLLILCDELQEWSRPSYGESQNNFPLSCNICEESDTVHVKYYFENLGEDEIAFVDKKYAKICEILDISSFNFELKPALSLTRYE